MLDRRRIKADAAALALLALTGILALSLLTYNPHDPVLNLYDLSNRPSDLVYPPPAAVTNLCGRGGAVTADLLFASVGLGGYFLVASLGIVGFWMITHRRFTEPVARSVGWMLALVGGTTLMAMALPTMSPGPVIGSGGYLGAAGQTFLESHFASVGAYVLVVTVSLGGLLLCTDYVLFRIVGWLVLSPAGHAFARVTGARRRGSRGWVQRLYVHAKHAAGGENEKTPLVRIKGRKSKPAEDEQYEVEDETEPFEDDVDDSFDEEMSEEPAVATKHTRPARSKKRRPSLLRIKTPPNQDERQLVIAELEAASSQIDAADDYQLPGLDLLAPADDVSYEEHEKEVRHKANLLEKTFANFGLNVRVVEIETGPVIAQYEVELEAGLRLSRITGLADDLAIALRVPSVRIVAPIPGKNTVGVEVPNANRQLVRLREVIEEAGAGVKKMKIPIYLGKDVSGNPMVADLASLPHLLIAGRTGTGKSVCLNSIIASMLMTRRPDEVKMLLIDPKMVELSPYKTLPHLMHPVVTDMRKAEAILAWAVEKMEERYALLASAGVRHISGYNQLGEEEILERLDPQSDEERDQIPTQLPFIVIVADEMADLMMTAAKEVEGHIIRLAQKSRAVGIHLVLATQKPTVDVITGLIKSNLPARIAFQVASRTDSRVVLDEMGADKLLGNGDMLFLWPGTSTLHRGQGTFVGDDEVTALVNFVGTSEPEYVTELVQLKATVGDGPSGAPKNRDDLYEAAIDIVVREGRGSVSLLQRSLGIGYGRAARLIDFMAEDGIVGQYNGSQAREVLVTLEQWAAMNNEAEAAPAAPPRPKRNKKVVLKPADTAADVDEEEPPFDEEEAYDDSESDEESDEEYDEEYDEDEEEYEDDDPEDEYEEEEEDYEEYDDESEDEEEEEYEAESA